MCNSLLRVYPVAIRQRHYSFGILFGIGTEYIFLLLLLMILERTGLELKPIEVSGSLSVVHWAVSFCESDYSNGCGKL